MDLKAFHERVSQECGRRAYHIYHAPGAPGKDGAFFAHDMLSEEGALYSASDNPKDNRFDRLPDVGDWPSKNASITVGRVVVKDEFRGRGEDTISLDGVLAHKHLRRPFEKKCSMPQSRTE